jgi:hypothetical protein
MCVLCREESMKIFQVDDENTTIIEAVLNSLSRKEPDSKIDCFVFGVVYDDQKYSIGYYNASPSDMAKVASYIQLDANLRFVALNQDSIDEYREEEGDVK